MMRPKIGGIVLFEILSSHYRGPLKLCDEAPTLFVVIGLLKLLVWCCDDLLK
jgi:hypothetical protein